MSKSMTASQDGVEMDAVKHNMMEILATTDNFFTTSSHWYSIAISIQI